MVPEAQMEDGAAGKKPAGEGWFVVNARDAAWIHNEKFGAGVTFEGTPHFPHYGINVQVVWPGQPNCYYHAEEGQEDFLVLSGECLLLVEGQERRLARLGLRALPAVDGACLRRRGRRAVRVPRGRRAQCRRGTALPGLRAGAPPRGRRYRGGDQRQGGLRRHT